MTRAFRRLARSPGYLLLSVALLTAGVTTNALVYAAAEALLWNPFHVQASGDLYAIRRGTSGAPFRNDHLAAMRDALSGSLALTGFVARDAPVRISSSAAQQDGRAAICWWARPGGPIAAMSRSTDRGCGHALAQRACPCGTCPALEHGAADARRIAGDYSSHG